MQGTRRQPTNMIEAPEIEQHPDQPARTRASMNLSPHQPSHPVPLQTRNSKKRKLWETDLAANDMALVNPKRRRENDIGHLIRHLEAIRD